ncbi:hypothetical protein [Paraburkholderia gardini]|uniref:hypothetical protein n=1 Tax=Paraburkholderia gardini TaxID=2823469 RepID=UPI001E089FAD|nr:hypothetical protein [Paraburkholderia gardini]CAG4889255.1 hypothetical protein R69919_00696 [Paraburkholderia gardini]
MKTIQSCRVRHGARTACPVRVDHKPNRAWRTAAIAAALGCATVAAHAESFFQLEAGVGGSGYSRGADGFWYQDGFEHKLQLTAPAFEVGITGDLYQASHWGLSYHVDWAWLGTIHTQAMAVPNDYNYNVVTKGCNGPCLPLANYAGSGHEQGFILTLDPHYDIGGWRFGVAAGPFIHHATWAEDVTHIVYAPGDPAINLHMASTDGWRIGAVIGASVEYKRFSIAYQHFITHASYGNTAPPIWHSVDLLIARYRF